MCVRSVLAMLFVGALLAGPAPAQDLKSIEAAESVLEAAWQKTPLGFRTAVFVGGEASGFGIYQPRANSAFASGEPIVVYSEPYGYAFKDNGDGTFDFALQTDLRIRGTDGKVLVEQLNFGNFKFTSRARNREFMLKLTLDLADAPAGDYVLEYVVRDANSDKNGLISLPFSVSK